MVCGKKKKEVWGGGGIYRQEGGGKRRFGECSQFTPKQFTLRRCTVVVHMKRIGSSSIESRVMTDGS